jgi:hypothetical protein
VPVEPVLPAADGGPAVVGEEVPDVAVIVDDEMTPRPAGTVDPDGPSGP